MNLRFGGSSYQPLNKVLISKDNLLANYRYLLSLSNRFIAPVLKSNAYGHGLVETAKVLDSVGAPFFCVDSLYEAYAIYKAGVKTPILIMGYVNPENLKVKKLPFSYAVWDIETIKKISKYQPNAELHLFIDTGMRREGVMSDELRVLSLELKKFNIVGVMSHLGEPADQKTSENQIKEFNNAVKLLEENGINPKWKHILSSNIIQTMEFTLNAVKGELNMVRVGIALYGLEEDKNLKPVLELTSTLVQIKKIKKGDEVGYDFTFKAPKDMVVGILPIGYNDGVDRRLSNIGCVTLRDTPCQIIGRVNMNITVIDLTNVPNPKVGDQVIIYSNNSQSPNSISSNAKLLKTIPHEILVGINSSIRREII